MKKHFLITTIFVLSCARLMAGTDSNPSMSRIQGNQFTPEVPVSQDAGKIGTLVNNQIFGTNGIISLAAQVPGSQAVATTVLDTGSIATVFNDGTHTYMVQYTQQGDVDTSFATQTGNILELTNFANASLSITVDAQNRFLLAGSDDVNSVPWIQRVNPDGTVDTSFTFTDGQSWTSSGTINQLGIQTLGQIIAVGGNGTNAMIARYNLSGAVDTSFGTNGYVILDGSATRAAMLPTSVMALRSVVIDAFNNIYIAFVNESSVYVTRCTPQGMIDSSWNSGQPVLISFLSRSGIVAEQLMIQLDAQGDLIVAVPSGNPLAIGAASIQVDSGAPGRFANFMTTQAVFQAHNYRLLNMMTTSDGSVYFLGSDITANQMMIFRCTGSGMLDKTFNGSGVNFFTATPVSSAGYADVNCGSINSDGQIFLAAAQFDNGITTPYLCNLFNNQKISLVQQFPPAQEQGILDTAFGSATTYPGVVSLFNGLYRGGLLQKAQAVTELASGNILIGLDGFTDTSGLKTMMLVKLLTTGNFDTTFGFTGKLYLPNLTGTHEYLSNVLEDAYGNLYIAGWSDVGAIFRKYTNNGMLIWNGDYLSAGYKGLACGLASVSTALLFLGGPGLRGKVMAYQIDTGYIDTSFHADGSSPGSITSTDFNLDMGPLYSGIVTTIGTIYYAYQNSHSGYINVAGVLPDGSALIPSFGIDGIVSNIFSTSSISSQDVRVSLNNEGNILVSAALGSDFYAAILDINSGLVLPGYPLLIPIDGAIALSIKQVVGVSDGSFLLAGYDGANNGSMYVLRISSAGVLDVTFNSQGESPGILPIRIGNVVAEFYGRIASGLTMQSHIGGNQGNLIMSAYEQVFMNNSTPMAMRIFGQPETTQIRNFPGLIKIPGEMDTSYNQTGIAQTYVQGATSSAANQEVRVIKELLGTQIMTIVTDNNSSISYTLRLNADSSVDTTYGNGLGIPITKLSGTEVVESMSFDYAGNFLVTGNNSQYGGYLKRIRPSGSLDSLFGGFAASSPTIQTYPIGTVYNLMDTVNACQQLTNGNIVLVGSLAGVGTIMMVNSYGVPVASFGVNGLVSYGVNATSVSVDPSNNIYISIAYVDTDTQLKAGILKLNAAGQPIASFGAHGFVGQALEVIDNAQGLRLVFDANSRIIIAGSYGYQTGRVVLNRFSSTGAVDTTFHNGTELDINFTSQATVVVSGLSVLQNNTIFVSGYQYNATNINNNYEFIAAIDESGYLDRNFGSGTTQGLVTFQAAESPQLARKLLDLSVQSDGNILLSGGEVPALYQETPLTFRLYGYPNVSSVAQFTGYQGSSPTIFNPIYNGTGIAESPVIQDLWQVGTIAMDHFGQALIGGVLATGQFVVVRYVNTGTLDPSFGIGGIAISPLVPSLVGGGNIAVDLLGNIYVAGITSAHKLVVLKLTTEGMYDTTNFGSQGMAFSPVITNLFQGGSIAVDFGNNILVAGYTTSGNLVAIRFLENGQIDQSFAPTTNYVASVVIPGLLTGGNVAIDRLNNVYLGAATFTTLEIAMLNYDGTLNINAFGTQGIASTQAVSGGLVGGGSLALDSRGNVVIAGLTGGEEFVVALFTALGQLNMNFNQTGVAYSSPVDLLDKFGNIALDNSDNIIVSGVISNYNQQNGISIARFLPIGILDTTFAPGGMFAITSLSNFIAGGVCAVDVYDNIFAGGLTTSPGFVVCQMYSGHEIFITNIQELTSVDIKSFYYGNNPTFLSHVLNAPYFAQFIADKNVRTAVLANVLAILDSYIEVYTGQPGWNLVWHLYLKLTAFEASRRNLNSLYPNSENDINTFFTKLSLRITQMKYAS